MPTRKKFGLRPIENKAAKSNVQKGLKPTPGLKPNATGSEKQPPPPPGGGSASKGERG